MSHLVNRNSKRGTMLVVVLGLLVALFVIGTSFSFVTLSERKAAQNYLDRQRALDLALDGVEYSIARLRAEATQKHYEGIGPSIAGLDDSGKEYDPRRYALHPLDAKDPAVSWSKFASRSGSAGTPDGNWVDFDGDNNRGGEESSFGTDKNEPGFARAITGFGGDGISNNQVRNENVERARDANYGPSGTYEPLGDYFRVRAVDAASLLNINNYREERLEQVLMTLGNAIDGWLNRGKPTGKDNPLPGEVVKEFMIVAENSGWRFTSKEQLRPIWQKFEGGDRMYEMAMNFITVNSWVDNDYRDYAASNLKVEEDKQLNPLDLTDVQRWREGYTVDAGSGQDGWPDWQPNPSSSSKAPININTATLPVLVCLFANIEARARLLFFQKQDQITENDQLIKDKFNQDVPSQVSGTTDLGRQNNKSDVANTGVQGESNWFPSGSDNRAIFQLVPIGPITSGLANVGNTSSSAGGADYATALAKQVMRLRTDHPFTSWQDFDARFFRGTLLGLIDSDARNQMTVPDLVGVMRSDLSRNPSAVDGAYPKDLLPDAANCQHAANPIKSGDTAMTGSDFRAWYWKSCVDMLRAALCPVNLTARYNADYPMHMNVDRMDLTVTSSPICFSSMGIYEIISQGELMAPEVRGDRSTSTVPIDQRRPVARRQVRTTVEIYQVLRHSNQRDFASPVTAADIQKAATSTTPAIPEALSQLTKPGTKTGPWSVDESSSGIWERNDAGETQFLSQLDDGKAIGYKPTVAGQPSPLKDRVKGHNEYLSASNDYGWVTMNPRDESPWTYTRENNYPLTFHARFNESLNGRTKSSQFGNVKVDGLNSDQINRDEEWGHRPMMHGVFEDFISTATPRNTEAGLIDPNTGLPVKGLSNEFVGADSGEQATKYSSLLADGVRLSGQHLRPRAEKSLKGTFSARGLTRFPRLKLLRYPCGSGGTASSAQVNWLGPVRTSAAYGDPEMDDGVNDPSQVGYFDPSNPGGDEATMRQRLIGTSPPFRGTDQHNEDAEYHRQHRSNMPYYQGTVDFWIKWDLPAQGANSLNADMVVALGEIDPASHNFSGLFGCTAYGRFKDSLLSSRADNPPVLRDSTADFEGVQFFVYKQPGGWWRFTRLYFMEAFSANVPAGATGSGTSTVVQFGTAMRRIFDQTNPLGGYTGTNDICNDVNFGNDNLGFLYARTDAWLDMSTATWSSAGQGRIMMRPHDWHRFTLSYNSNTDTPFRLWLDGRGINGVAFFPDADINNPLGFRNDGRHAPLTDTLLPPDDPSGAEFDVYRTTTKLLEINPEDRLTVGCITRRQLDLSASSSTVYDDYFDNDPDQGDVDKPPRPVFKFDSNFVAVANATIDDFRVTDQLIPAGTDLQPSEFQPYSRYTPVGQPAHYENGFLPIRDSDKHLHAAPVRLGTISWIELRPDWDPYTGKGLALRTSAQLEMEWGVVDDYLSIRAGGSRFDLGQAKFKGNSGRRDKEVVKDANYWASGGMTLNNAILPSGNKVGVLLYRVHFKSPDVPNYRVNNVTPYLLDVTVTLLTPPRKLTFVIDY